VQRPLRVFSEFSHSLSERSESLDRFGGKLPRGPLGRQLRPPIPGRAGLGGIDLVTEIAGQRGRGGGHQVAQPARCLIQLLVGGVSVPGYAGQPGDLLPGEVCP
jgi:hypothetical protein